MSQPHSTRQRIKFLATSVTSEMSRYQGREFFVEFFLYPFRLELAQRNGGKPGFQFRPEEVNQTEFNQVVEIYRRLAKRMPEAYHLEDTPISVFDPPGRIVGWRDMDAKGRIYPGGLGLVLDQVLEEMGLRRET